MNPFRERSHEVARDAGRTMRTPRHIMLERDVQSNEAKNVSLEEEAVDMRGGSDRF